MRVAGEAIARQAGIENGDLAAGTAELQGAGETGKAAADDDDVIHGDGLRVMDGGGWAGPGAISSSDTRSRDGSRRGGGTRLEKTIVIVAVLFGQHRQTTPSRSWRPIARTASTAARH